MKVLVIGGHTRNIGKTSLAASIIREFRFLNWTAVKITQYGHGVCSHDGIPCQCAPGRHAFVLTPEQDPHGRADTCRLLAAGAKRSLWLRVRQGQLGEAFPTLERSLSSEEYVLIESNSILTFLEPLLYLVLLDSAKHDFKDSTRRFLHFADALICVGPSLSHGMWPSIEPQRLASKPLFPVSASEYFSPDLSRFVRAKLGLM
jgi:molybdopterin-guanine dinucleotide biosynthesis protein